MNILLVNADDGTGGAARAAMRLHLGLRNLAADARLLVQKKQTDLDSVLGPRPLLGYWQGELRPHLDALPVLRYPQRTGALFSLASLPGNFLQRVAAQSPDLVHLHWVCNGMLRLEALRRLNRPIVWTLHDSWAFTGGCHLPGACDRYRSSCGACPVLGSARDGDLSRRGWERKRRVLADLDLTIVTPSRWLAECAGQSPLLATRRIEVIPNGLDVDQFRPVEKAEARSVLGLPQEVPLVLYCGVQAATDRNKGKDLLLEAMGKCSPEQLRCFELVVLGTSSALGFEELGLKTHSLGRLNDEVALRLAYGAADLLVLPSREENLPYTIMEAMACGLPCLAFDVGGIGDLVDQMATGYLVPPFDVEAFGAMLVRLMNDSVLRTTMGEKARGKAVAEFALPSIAQRHLDLYGDLV